MELLNFINSHTSNWESLLKDSPYYLSIKNSYPYYLLMYDQTRSDMSISIVQQARGIIIRKVPNSEEYAAVCVPFYKFFNWNEQYSAIDKIDWATASVQQKVDGSIIKMFFDPYAPETGWHIATNKSIDANNAECGFTTYGKLVREVLDKTTYRFFESLDTNYCYMFELTTKYNQVVINYDEDHLWYLGRRNMHTLQEDCKPLNIVGILTPARFPHTSLDACVEAAHHMGDDEEGYVVCDANFNRVKIKGDEYLRLHHLRGNGIITIKRVVNMWLDGSLDDFNAYFPQYNEFTTSVISNIIELGIHLDTIYAMIISLPTVLTRKDFALACTNAYPITRAYLFKRYDNKVANGYEFCRTAAASKLLIDALNKRLKIKEIGVSEDEQYEGFG